MHNKKLINKSLLMMACYLASPIMVSEAKNLIYTPDGRTVEIKGGVTQPDLSAYRSPLESKIIDRRFYTNEATFLANESFKFGMEGFNDVVKGAYPVAYKRPFQWITSREMYFYARYLLDFTGGRGHAGVHMLHGPYWTLKAHEHSDYNKFLRDRGEVNFSNKDVLLGFYLPMVYQRTGFPRVFEDLQLTYLQYKSVDPHFTAALDNKDTFEDTMSGKKGGWGQPNAYFNDHPQRFDHDEMDTTFDMGGIGQYVKRRMQWSDLFYHSNHTGESKISRGEKISLLGNDAEEGLRGFGLGMGALNAILEVKSSMFTDGEKLMGINPATYDPENGLKYIPHEISPTLLWIGDLPERVDSLELKDSTSLLWDQASWIWGTTGYSVTANRRTDAYTDNPPVDGGVIPRSTRLVAEAMTNAIFKNVEAMHINNNVLVSEWTPETGTGDTINMRNMAMMMVALHDMEQNWHNLNKHSEIEKRALTLLSNNADFLLKVQSKDGSFNDDYNVISGKAIGEADLASANWAAIRSLVAAYFSTENEAYLSAARKTFNLLNTEYWVEAQGVYRSKRNSDTIEVTPYNTGIALAAMREILFATPTYMSDAQIERITRWWIQTVDMSGSIQSETNRTGEIYTGFISNDDDADGILNYSQSHGEHGIAPLIAGKVVINVGGANNEEFNSMQGELHSITENSNVRMHYKPKTAQQQQSIILPLKNPQVAGLVERQPMQRIDGTIIPMQATKPITIGLGTLLDLSGKQIFNANCSKCHGEHGEGIDGFPLKRASEWPKQTLADFAYHGSFKEFMPPWGAGNGDAAGGTLTKDELSRIAEYIGSDEFKDNFATTQQAKVVPGSLPKDVWFYLSRENAQAKGQKISDAKDAKRIFDQHIDPAKIRSKFSDNLPRLKADADLTIKDKSMLMDAYKKPSSQN